MVFLVSKSDTAWKFVNILNGGEFVKGKNTKCLIELRL